MWSREYLVKFPSLLDRTLSVAPLLWSHLVRGGARKPKGQRPGGMGTELPAQSRLRRVQEVYDQFAALVGEMKTQSCWIEENREYDGAAIYGDRPFTPWGSWGSRIRSVHQLSNFAGSHGFTERGLSRKIDKGLQIWGAHRT